MRWIAFKVIIFLSAFIFMQGVVLPWSVSNNSFPIWIDLLIITIILLMWLAILDRLAHQVLKYLGRNDEHD